MTSEVVNPRVVGNAVTIQFGIGFLMTMPGMFIVPSIVAGTNNWGLAWSTLTPGTVIAAFAMLMMRRNHIALRVAKERGRRFM
jgi:cyanate permease